MKKISILTFFSALLFLTGCEEVETPDLGIKTQWIQFGNSSYAVPENSAEALIIPIQYAADSNPNGVTVNYSLSSESPDAFEISPSTGTIDIPAGEFEAFLKITPLDNALTDGNKIISISIDNEDIPVGINGEGKLNDKTLITITDNDCELNYSEFAGNYRPIEYGYCEGCYEVKVTYDQVQGVLVLSNLYETGGTTYLSLDNSDPENPKIKYKSYELGGIIYNHPNNGPGYAMNKSSFSGYSEADDISSFRTCDQFMDLYFFIYYPDVGQIADVHIDLTKI